MRLSRFVLAPVSFAVFALASAAALAQDKPADDPEIVIAPNPDGSGWRIEQLFDFINRFTGKFNTFFLHVTIISF